MFSLVKALSKFDGFNNLEKVDSSSSEIRYFSIQVAVSWFSYLRYTPLPHLLFVHCGSIGHVEKGDGVHGSRVSDRF